MAVLTWRNVDAPNLSGRTEGTAIAARLFGNATSNLSDALGGFGKFQSEQADNAASLAALRYQDPAQLQSALANGSLLNGVDASKLDPSAIAALGSRVSDLLNQQTTQQNLAKTQYEFGQQQQADTATKAAQPILNQAALLQSQGKGTDAAALLGAPENQQLLSALKPTQFSTALQGDLTLNGTNTTNADSALRLSIAQRTDKDNQAGLAAAQQIAPTAGDARTAYDNLAKLNLSPGAYQAASQHLATLGYANPNTAIETGAGGAIATAAGAPGTKGGNLADATYGFTPTPGGVGITSMPIRDVLGVQQNLIDTKGNSPVGLFQINKGTLQDFAPKVLGANWQDQPLTVDNQNKVGEAVFNDRKSGVLSDTWAALKGVPGADTAGGLKDKSWNDVRELIASRELGADPMTVRQTLQNSQNQTFLTGSGIVDRNAQNNALTAAPGWQDASKNTGSIADIADQTSKGKGPLAGTPANWISAQIQQIMDLSDQPDENGNRSGNQLNAAQAELILEKSMRAGPQSKVAQFLGKPGLITDGSLAENGMTPDMGVAKALVGQASAGMPREQNLETQMLAQQSQALQSAQDMQTQAYAQLQAAQIAKASGRNLDDAYMSRLNDRWAAATARVNALNAAIRADAANKPKGQTGKAAVGKDVAKSIRDAATAGAPQVQNDGLDIFRQNPLL